MKLVPCSYCRMRPTPKQYMLKGLMKTENERQLVLKVKYSRHPKTARTACLSDELSSKVESDVQNNVGQSVRLT